MFMLEIYKTKVNRPRGQATLVDLCILFRLFGLLAFKTFNLFGFQIF